ncbi:hypothetical protein N9W34_03455 [Rickettsiales bacterium]|nr:hypothetical protein [Rickettsiales bacterium]
MKNKKIQKSLDNIIDTIRNPAGIATGDAISVLIKELIKTEPKIKTEAVISILQDAGFRSADGLKDFIYTQIELQKGKNK